MSVQLAQNLVIIIILNIEQRLSTSENLSKICQGSSEVKGHKEVKFWKLPISLELELDENEPEHQGNMLKK